MALVSQSLASIVSSFTKLEKKLDAFVKENGTKIQKTQADLRVQQTEQEKAQRILKNVKRFTEGD